MNLANPAVIVLWNEIFPIVIFTVNFIPPKKRPSGCFPESLKDFFEIFT
jgi:hypothetical protein